jgi:hypothetical protein
VVTVNPKAVRAESIKVAKSTPTPTPTPQPETPQQIVHNEMLKRWGEDEWPALEELVQRESGWRPCAQYPSSSNCTPTSTNACGLFQANPCQRLLGVIGTLDNVQGQAAWGMDYIADRYGSPSMALDFWLHQAPTYDLNGDGVADGRNWY